MVQYDAGRFRNDASDYVGVSIVGEVTTYRTISGATGGLERRATLHSDRKESQNSKTYM
jgi:hypothetical protein